MNKFYFIPTWINPWSWEPGQKKVYRWLWFTFLRRTTAKLKPYNRFKKYDLWRECDYRCKNWPGNKFSKDFASRVCDSCPFWANLSDKEKSRYEQEKNDYARHCMTGE
jgi:hypothetical protein